MLFTFPKNVVKVKLVLSVSVAQPEQNACILNDSLSQFIYHLQTSVKLEKIQEEVE